MRHATYFRFGLFIIPLLPFCVSAVPNIEPPAIWRPVFPPTTQQNQWAANEVRESRQMGMTLDDYRLLEKKLVIDPEHTLLYDIKAMLAVTFTSNSDGSTKDIVIQPDSRGSEIANVDYQLSHGNKRGKVIYSGALPKGDKDTRAAIWIDLNADGIFDLLLVPVNHNDLLELDRGVYILLNGKWTRAVLKNGADENKGPYLVGATTYFFNDSSGRWVKTNQKK